MLLWRQLVVGVLPTMCDTREGRGRGPCLKALLFLLLQK